MTSFTGFRFPTLPLAEESTESGRSIETEPAKSDEYLLARVCQDDRQALAELFRRHARIVRGIARRVLRDDAEADDLLQDIFLLIYRDCANFDRTKGSGRHWILQMTYRRAISRRRYLSTRHFYNRLDLEHADRQTVSQNAIARSAESFEGVFESRRLRRAFRELSENQRKALLLRFVEGYTLEEIAQKLGQSRANVKNHYFRGLERLRMQVFGTRLNVPPSASSQDFHSTNLLPTAQKAQKV